MEMKVISPYYGRCFLALLSTYFVLTHIFQYVTEVTEEEEEQISLWFPSDVKIVVSGQIVNQELRINITKVT